VTVHRPLIAALIAFLLAGAAAVAVVWQSEQFRLQDQRAGLANLATYYGDVIQSNMHSALSTTYALATLVRQGQGSIANFDTTASEMLRYYPGAASLQLAPGGIIQQIVPLAGNEKAIGINMLQDRTRNREASLLRDTGQLILVGPFDLIEGGLGALGRLSVFLDDSQGKPQFWGFTIVRIRFPQALEAARLAQLTQQGLGYELWRIHPDSGQKQSIAASSTAALIDPVATTLAMPNGNWTLSVAPLKGWGEPLWLALKSVLALLFSLLLGYLAKLLIEARQLSASLRVSQRRERAMLDNMPEGIVSISETGMIEMFNPAAEGLFGYASSEVVGKNVSLLMPEPYHSEHDGHLARYKRTDQMHIIGSARELMAKRSDGSVFPIILQVSEFFLDGRRQFIGSISDITERKRTAIALRDSAARLRSVFEYSKVGMTVRDADGRYVDVNPAFIAMTGFSKEELLGHTADDFTHPDDLESSAALINTLLTGARDQYEVEKRYIRKDGSTLWADVTISTGRDDAGKIVSAIGIIQDITERKKSEALIWQQANFDSLTGLPNRHMFYDRLGQAIKKSHRSGLPMALLLLDLDRFKEVNDTLGHAQGDVLLVEVARRITECVRESDTVARLGGDEFIVILSEMEHTDTNSVERIAQKIIERLAAPFQLLQETVFVSASMGITLYPNDAQDVDSLIKSADQAMYLAKDSGRNRFSYFTAALQEAAQARLHLLSDLRHALLGKQLAVHYQPIVELATGKIVKAEALLRWQHPVRGMVSPAQFIPLAEDAGLIHDIGDWVFHETAREVKRCRELFGPEFQISLNVSPVQFRQNRADNAASWISYLRAMDLPGQSLVIEITEGLLLDAEENVIEKLRAFHNAGMQVSVDDFGTGYSSLSYLKKFDIDYLKIDQSFIHNLESAPSDKALCEAIIVMAHKLGLRVIAEGVETEQQRDLLAAYGCDYAQGWLYSKALPAGEFEALLQGQGK